jgi:hypothetical protein
LPCQNHFGIVPEVPSSEINVRSYGVPSVPFGDMLVHRRAVIELRGWEGVADVVAECRMEEGIPSVISLTLTPGPGLSAVTARDLRRIPAPEALAVQALSKNAVHLRAPGRASPSQGRREATKVRQALEERAGGPAARRNSVSPEQLRMVAELYRKHVDGAPVQVIAATLDLSERTAARRVEQARQAGLLPPTRKGQKKA